MGYGSGTLLASFNFRRRVILNESSVRAPEPARKQSRSRTITWNTDDLVNKLITIENSLNRLAQFPVSCGPARSMVKCYVSDTT